MVSFKGARDVRMVLKAVQEIAGMECTARAGSTGVGCDVFNVHMAVVTALLGKKLSVYDECALERWAVRARHRHPCDRSERATPAGSSSTLHGTGRGLG